MSMAEKPLVSIVIPVYNGSRYLHDAIDSALAQTYKNIEVIVVNDGSSDKGKTREIALSYGNRIRYFEKNNGGVASALNFGIRVMKGEYFSWLSHDDIYYEDKIEKQIRFILERNNDNLIIFSDYTLLLNNGKIIIDSPGYLYSLSKKNAFYGVLFNIIHGCTIIIPRECFKTVGMFNEELATTNDYDMFYRLGVKYNFGYLSEYLVKVRIHENQDSVKKLLNHYNDCNQLWINFIDTYPNEKICMNEKSRYIFYEKLVNFLKRSPYRDALDFCKKKSNHSFKERLLLNCFVKYTPIVSGIILYKVWYIKIKKIYIRLQFLWKHK